jgi:hypothetical protein
MSVVPKPLDALYELAHREGWRVGLTGIMDGSEAEGQEVICLEVREGAGGDWYALDLIATYALAGRTFDGAKVDVPIFVAAAGLVTALEQGAE